MSNLAVILTSEIDGSFHGFNGDSLFKLTNGTFWLQDEYKYWYHYEYRPRVEILQRNGFFLRVVGQREMVAVRQTHDVVESRIVGEFKGWEGDTSYQLANGQVWKQSHYKYQYKYAYAPVVRVFRSGGGHIMEVADTSAKVRRVR